MAGHAAEEGEDRCACKHALAGPVHPPPPSHEPALLTFYTHSAASWPFPGATGLPEGREHACSSARPLGAWPGPLRCGLSTDCFKEHQVPSVPSHLGTMEIRQSGGGHVLLSVIFVQQTPGPLRKTCDKPRGTAESAWPRLPSGALSAGRLGPGPGLRRKTGRVRPLASSHQTRLH